METKTIYWGLLYQSQIQEQKITKYNNWKSVNQFEIAIQCGCKLHWEYKRPAQFTILILLGTHSLLVKRRQEHICVSKYSKSLSSQEFSSAAIHPPTLRRQLG